MKEFVCYSGDSLNIVATLRKDGTLYKLTKKDNLIMSIKRFYQKEEPIIQMAVNKSSPLSNGVYVFSFTNEQTEKLSGKYLFDIFFYNGSEKCMVVENSIIKFLPSITKAVS